MAFSPLGFVHAADQPLLTALHVHLILLGLWKFSLGFSGAETDSRVPHIGVDRLPVTLENEIALLFVGQQETIAAVEKDGLSFPENAQDAHPRGLINTT